MNQNSYDPYLAGLELVKKNWDTSSQVAMAKCILMLYNGDRHSFPIGVILRSVDENYERVIFEMLTAYSKRGETAELRQAGEYVVENFPGLLELTKAAYDAMSKVRKEWRRQEEEEMARLYPYG